MSALNVAPSSRAPHGTRNQGQDYAQLAAAIAALPTKRAAVDYLIRECPHLSRSWVKRHWDQLTAMDPEQLRRAVGIPDPTGNTAARNVDASRRGGARAHV